MLLSFLVELAFFIELALQDYFIQKQKCFLVCILLLAELAEPPTKLSKKGDGQDLNFERGVPRKEGVTLFRVVAILQEK